MGKLIGAGRRPRHGALAVLAASAMICLTACGTVTAGRSAPPPGSRRSSPPGPSAPGSAHPIGATLCAARGQVETVVVTRLPALPLGTTRPAQPASVTVAAVPRVRALAEALCVLPELPQGVMSCPADFGGGYRMVFSVPGRQYPAVTAKSSGCRTVTGVGRLRVAGAAFWRALAFALDSRGPGAAPGGPSQP